MELPYLPGTIFQKEGREVHYFGGTDYLGMAHHPVYKNLLQQNIQKHGATYGASRVSNLQLELYGRAEKQLAKLCGSENALLLSSGYLAGQLIHQLFHTADYLPVALSGTHSSIVRKGVFLAPDSEVLTMQVNHALKTKRIPVIYLDHIQMSGQLFPEYPLLKSLPLESCILVIDDSHGIGLVGETGWDTYRRLLAFNPRSLLVTASLGKALGLPSGVVLGDQRHLEHLRQSELFQGASPSPPAYLACFSALFPIYKEQLMLLREKLIFFEKRLERPQDFKTLPGYPVYSYREPKLKDYLLELEIMTSDFIYQGEAVRRIVITAAHSAKQLEYLALTLNKFRLS